MIPKFHDGFATDLPEINSEIDVPFITDAVPTEVEPPITIMSKHDVRNYEDKLKYLKGMKALQLKDHALHLIIACFVTMFVLYIVDALLMNFHLQNSEMASSVFDFLKYIITTLFGYLFATKSSPNE